MNNEYQQARNTRSEQRSKSARFRSGVLTPIMAIPFRENESAVITQSVNYILDPVQGEMVTDVHAQLFSVFVPLQAIDALANPDESFVGSEESIKQKLLSETPLFAMEEGGELTQRMAVIPASIDGRRLTCASSRIAHNCAVNYLRRRMHIDAPQLLAENKKVTPALLSTTILERMNGVNDPDVHVDGAVQFDVGNVKIPVQGIGVDTRWTHQVLTDREIRDSKIEKHPAEPRFPGTYLAANVHEDNALYPDIFVDLDHLSTGSVSLKDFYNAERTDKVTRKLREILEKNPEYGEEMVARLAHGLDVDTGKQPFMLYNKTQSLREFVKNATDGPNLDTIQTDLAGNIEFTVIVPKTMFGGYVITFAVVKPDETIEDQPHPLCSRPWTATNYIADSLKIDPVAVTARELDSNVEQENEGDIVLYTGHNEILRNYQNYGFTENLDPDDVQYKTAMWYHKIPASTTPENVLYPDDLDQYPFEFQDAEICTYTIHSTVSVQSPIEYGPSPVETISILEDQDIFEADVVE